MDDAGVLVSLPSQCTGGHSLPHVLDMNLGKQDFRLLLIMAFLQVLYPFAPFLFV